MLSLAGLKREKTQDDVTVAPLGFALEVQTMNVEPNDFAEGAARLAQMTDMTIDKIRKLAELHKEGILTDEEFDAKKAELLSHL